MGMISWISLAELAGIPVIKWVIQVIRRKVRRSIEKEISISGSECSISKDGWYLINLGISVTSKTPAKLQVIGIQYVIFHDGFPIHSGIWKHGSNLTSDGVEVKTITINPKGNVDMKIGINPRLVVTKVYLLTHEKWQVSGVLVIDCSYGQIYKNFRTPNMSVAEEKDWIEYANSLKGVLNA
ncbi:hypothetical protein ACFLUF_00410 [Chloroflexota bacterium]